jgi:hypothetical protein
MNIVFNELSFYPLQTSSYDLKKLFFNIIKQFEFLKLSYDFSHLVFPSDLSVIFVMQDVCIYEWINSLDMSSKLKLLSFIRKPFSNDIIEAETGNLDLFSFSNADLDIEGLTCVGFELAFLQGVPTISLNTDDLWQKDYLSFTKTDSLSLEDQEVEVINISDKEELSTCFKGFAELNSNIQLQETDLLYENKKISLRDDHGKDILEAFSKKLLRSVYVCNVINSLPFNSKAIRFIRRTSSDGKIEIILHWEDKGIGMIIQTTGRNKRETEKIADILREQFDK